MNFRVILNTLGWVLNCEGVCMILPLICAFAYKENDIYTFLISMAICLFFGFLLVNIKPKNKNMYAREGFIIAALSWILITIFGALPYLISGSIPSVVDAIFETASGFTTTGASILSDVEIMPKSILMWRGISYCILAFIRRK